ncbi:MAG: hypothetical protein DRJ40_09525 [Thermoprotei archaeon]|nr:MAG: hypothetical protein DRJ40_09525 [Thermoprotei archaeon]
MVQEVSLNIDSIRAEVGKLAETSLKTVCELTFEIITPLRIGSYKATPLEVHVIGSPEHPWSEQYVSKSVKGVLRYTLKHLLLGATIHAGVDISNEKVQKLVKELLVLCLGGKVPVTGKLVSSVYSIDARVIPEKYIEEDEIESFKEIPRLALLITRERSTLKDIEWLKSGGGINTQKLRQAIQRIRRIVDMLLDYWYEFGLTYEIHSELKQIKEQLERIRRISVQEVQRLVLVLASLCEKIKYENITETIRKIMYEKISSIEQGKLHLKITRLNYEVLEEYARRYYEALKEAGISLPSIGVLLDAIKSFDYLMVYSAILSALLYGYGQCTRRGFCSLKLLLDRSYIPYDEIRKVVKEVIEPIDKMNHEIAENKLWKLIETAIVEAENALKRFGKSRGIDFDKLKRELYTKCPRYFALTLDREITRIRVISVETTGLSHLLRKIGEATMKVTWKKLCGRSPKVADGKWHTWILGLPREQRGTGYSPGMNLRRPSPLFMRVLNYDSRTNRALVLVWGSISMDWPVSELVWVSDTRGLSPVRELSIIRLIRRGKCEELKPPANVLDLIRTCFEVAFEFVLEALR